MTNGTNKKATAILRQITTKRAYSCTNCLHYDICYYYRKDLDTNLATICKYAEEIIVQENKND